MFTPFFHIFFNLILVPKKMSPTPEKRLQPLSLHILFISDLSSYLYIQFDFFLNIGASVRAKRVFFKPKYMPQTQEMYSDLFTSGSVRHIWEHYQNFPSMFIFLCVFAFLNMLKQQQVPAEDWLPLWPHSQNIQILLGAFLCSFHVLHTLQLTKKKKTLNGSSSMRSHLRFSP